MSIIKEFDKLKKPESKEERKKFSDFRKKLKSSKQNSIAYSEYLSLTLDGMEAEEAAREVGFI